MIYQLMNDYTAKEDRQRNHEANLNPFSMYRIILTIQFPKGHLGILSEVKWDTPPEDDVTHRSHGYRQERRE